MSFTMAMLCLGVGIALLWVAFHDISTLTGTDKPTATDIIDLIMGR